MQVQFKLWCTIFPAGWQKSWEVHRSCVGRVRALTTLPAGGNQPGTAPTKGNKRAAWQKCSRLKESQDKLLSTTTSMCVCKAYIPNIHVVIYEILHSKSLEGDTRNRHSGCLYRRKPGVSGNRGKSQRDFCLFIAFEFYANYKAFEK